MAVVWFSWMVWSLLLGYWWPRCHVLWGGFYTISTTKFLPWIHVYCVGRCLAPFSAPSSTRTSSQYHHPLIPVSPNNLWPKETSLHRNSVQYVLVERMGSSISTNNSRRNIAKCEPPQHPRQGDVYVEEAPPALYNPKSMEERMYEKVSWWFCRLVTG